MKPNRKNPILLASLTFALTLAAPSAFATDLYWDTDDVIAGSGGATPSGSWATSGTTWSTDSTGSTATAALTTTGLDNLFFSAGPDATGSYGVSLGSAQSAKSMTFEEGAATLTGSTLTLAGGGGITVLAGAVNATISSNLTLSGNNIFNVGAGSTLTLNTGTFSRTNRATVNIQGAGNGSSTMTGLDVNVRSIIGPWASVTAGGTTTYARFTGALIGGLGYTGTADGTAVTAAGSVNSTTTNINYSLSVASGTGGTLAASASVNTLRFASAPGNYSLAVNTAFTTRGIMNVSGRQLDFNSTGGTVNAGTTSAAEMVVNAVSGNIRFLGTGSFNGNITKTGSAQLIFGGNANFSGISGITVNEGIFVTDAFTDNQLVGATINSGGTLRWARSNKHRDDSVFTINAGGILDLNAQTDTIGSIAGAGSITSTNAATMTLSGGTQAFSGVIGGAVSLALNLTPSSALTLAGNNTFTGGVTINAGTLTLANAGALNSTAGSENAVAFGASSTGTLALGGNSVVIRSLNSNATLGTPVVENANAGNATLTIGNSLNLASTYAGTIQDGSGGGTLALTKAGTNTLTLSGTNGYTGATDVNAGKLLVDGSIASGSAVTVGTNGTLGGTGTIHGTLAVTGILSPGTGLGDKQTLDAGTTTWNGGSIWNFDLSSTDDTSDKLAINGAFTKGNDSGFKFDFMGSTPKWAETYTLVTFGSTTFTSELDFDLAGSLATLGAGSYSTSSFTLNATSLTFTAVPEPTSALAGLLLTAGLLRRRRK